MLIFLFHGVFSLVEGVNSNDPSNTNFFFEIG